MIPTTRICISFNRSLHAENPRRKELPSLVLGLAEAVDRLMRSQGMVDLTWEIRDDGNLLEIVPMIPGDCLPEARKTINSLRKMGFKEKPKT